LGRRRNNLHPAVRALLHIGVIAFGILAVIPVNRFLRLEGRLDIHLWFWLLDDDRRRIVVAIIRVRIIWMVIIRMG
jgi:hypothetical protein